MSCESWVDGDPTQVEEDLWDDSLLEVSLPINIMCVCNPISYHFGMSSVLSIHVLFHAKVCVYIYTNIIPRHILYVAGRVLARN